ncbi:MAG: hypothetical protein OXF44_14055 [Anaerolineaceae bacterium]|nr:hypothetical protein [Anaerolineaceae bacterium]
MKSICTFTYAAMLIFLLGSFPVAGADSWQRGNQSCSVSDWFTPLRGSLERFATIFDEPSQRYTETLIEIERTLTSRERGANQSWLKEFLLNERDFFLVVHEASIGLVDASANVIEQCGLSDEVSDFLSTPVYSGPSLVESVESILSWNLDYLSPEMKEVVDPCWIVPAMEANFRLMIRFVSAEEELLYSGNLPGQDSRTVPPDLLVILYGLAFEFSEVSRVIVDDCGLTGSDSGGERTVSSDRVQTRAANVTPTATPVPQDPDTCQWKDAYRGLLDAFLIQANLVDADSPDAPGKLRDYVLNLVNSLDDIRAKCALP